MPCQWLERPDQGQRQSICFFLEVATLRSFCRRSLISFLTPCLFLMLTGLGEIRYTRRTREIEGGTRLHVEGFISCTGHSAANTGGKITQVLVPEIACGLSPGIHNLMFYPKVLRFCFFLRSVHLAGRRMLHFHVS